MVNTGRPSAACATCKKRRVKCDEGKPACRRCLKARLTCLGYGIHVAIAPSQQVAPRVLQHADRGEVVRPTIVRELLPLDFLHTLAYLRDSFNVVPSSADAPRGILANLDPAILMSSPANGALYAMLDVAGAGLLSLRDMYMILATRDRIRQRYVHALRQLRHDLEQPVRSKHLALAVLLMAVYHMIIESDGDDSVWLLHFTGLRSVVFSMQGSTVDGALQTETASVSASQQVDSILRSSVMMLFDLAPEMDADVTGSAVRKLDIQRIRSLVLKVHRNVGLVESLLQECKMLEIVPSSSSPSGSQLLSMHYNTSWTRYHIVNLVCAKFLLSTTIAVSRTPSDGGHKAKSNVALMRSLRGSVDYLVAVPSDGGSVEISDSFFPTTSQPMSLGQGLQQMWALATVLLARSFIPGPPCQWAQQRLSDIGDRAAIPKAHALANASSPKVTYTALLSGIVLTDFAVFDSTMGTGIPTVDRGQQG